MACGGRANVDVRAPSEHRLVIYVSISRFKGGDHQCVFILILCFVAYLHAAGVLRWTTFDHGESSVLL